MQEITINSSSEKLEESPKVISIQYGVFENGKACSAENFPQFRKSDAWKTHIFDTFEKAEDYALRWLGDDAANVKVFTLNVPFDYSGGFGSTIEIREIK